jgi:hypothetical protein
MAQPPDLPDLHAFVGQLVEQATDRLQTARTEARARDTALSTAKKDPGNRLRSNDIAAALGGEARLITDTAALAKRMPMVRRSMSADLERLLGVALTSDDAT